MKAPIIPTGGWEINNIVPGTWPTQPPIINQYDPDDFGPGI